LIDRERAGFTKNGDFERLLEMGFEAERFRGTDLTQLAERTEGWTSTVCLQTSTWSLTSKSGVYPRFYSLAR